MKKILACFLFLAMVLLISCSPADNVPQATETSGEPVQPMTPAADNQFYYFYSYAELFSALTDETDPIHERIRSRSNYCSVLYRNTLDQLQSGDLTIYVPQYKGEDMPLNDCVTFFSKERFTMPWIWYHLSAEGHHVAVKISYPELLNLYQMENITSAKEFIALMQWIPIGSLSSTTLNTFEKDVTLADGTTVRAFIQQAEIPNSEKTRRDFAFLYFDGILMELWSTADFFTDEFFANFSIKPYVDTIPQ
jgi:hypothetical protein